MTPSSQKWLFTFIAPSVLIHLISYGVKDFLSYDEVKYWYWILNSSTHICYLAFGYYLLKKEFARCESVLLKRLIIFIQDWFLFMGIELLNQFLSAYNPSPLPQWTAFVIVLFIQEIRFNQWKKQFPNRLR